MTAADRILVACVGNVFLGDDGFGVEVARELAAGPQTLPPEVEVADIGVAGVHLAYELLDGCALLVLVDAAPHGAAPGTVSVIEIGPGGTAAAVGRPLLDAHGLAPSDVFALLDAWGARPERAVLVACEPRDVTPGMELSAEVRAAVPHATRTVRDLVRRESAANKERRNSFDQG